VLNLDAFIIPLESRMLCFKLEKGSFIPVLVGPIDRYDGSSKPLFTLFPPSIRETSAKIDPNVYKSSVLPDFEAA
jgi:hypothetical protein